MAYIVKLTQLQRDNLLVLANFLERAVPPPNFDMSDFLNFQESEFNEGDYDSEDYIPNIDKPSVVAIPEIYNYCGTTACAVGHGPLAGIPPTKNETWSEYSIRNFGAGWNTDEENKQHLFEWCFSGGWNYKDNTPYGAAARIKWFLELGIPDDYQYQLDGEEPLCYEDRIIKNTTNPVYIMEEPIK